MRRIAFINEKGGSCKTTLAVNTAAWLATARDARVLLCDLDTQGHAGKSLGIDVRGLSPNIADLLCDPGVRGRFGHQALRVSMVVPTLYRKTALADAILAKLREKFPEQICRTVLGYNVQIDEAQSYGQTIWEYAPQSRGAQLLEAIGRELVSRGAAVGGQAAAS